MEERNGQIYGRDFHEDLQRLGRIAADIGSDDLEEEIHLCFTNGFSQILPSFITAHNTPEFNKQVATSKSSVVEVGWMSVLSQMEPNAKIYSHWAELLHPITNSSMERIPWTIKSADETVGAELSWEVWLTTSLLSIAVLGDLLMAASSLVLETSKLPAENSCYLEHPRTLSSHLKEIGLRGYVTLSQVFQQIWNELKRIPQINCYTPEQLSDLLNLPRLLVNLEDLISRIIVVHNAQSKVADCFMGAETTLEEEDFGRRGVVPLLSTASVIFIHLTKLWHNLQDFFFMCFGENNIPQLEERNVTEPLERILYCTNLLGDLVTANPEDVHKTWHDLINSCKKAVDVVELQNIPLR